MLQNTSILLKRTIVAENQADFSATIREYKSDEFDIGGRDPALAAVGEFDIVPVADAVEDPDLCAFVKDEEVLGSLCRRRTLG